MIICTGPISSGTRMLASIVKSWGIDSAHLSMPQWDTFWTPGDLDVVPDKYVIIVRRPDISVMSAFAQGHGNPALGGHWKDYDHRMSPAELDDWWWRAMEALAKLSPALWVSYEALVAEPFVQLRMIADFVGSENCNPPFTIKDGNKKWLSQRS